MASQFDDILTKYRKVQPTGEEGVPTANQLQPAGTGPMDMDTILKKYEKPSTLSDIGQTIVGLPRTGAEMLTGMGGSLFDMQSYLAQKAMAASGIWTPEEVAAYQKQWDEERWLANPQEVSQTNTELLDSVGLPKGIEEASRYQPQTRGGQVAQTIGLLAPGLISGGGSLPANLISRVGIPAGMIEGGAEVGKAFGDETMGRMLGGLGAMAAPATWNRASRPYPAEPGRQPLRDVLDRERVPYTAGQATGNDRLLYRESVAGEMPALQEQGPAFTEAAARTQGGFPPGTNTLSREAMGAELQRMGTEFERMAGLSNAPYTTQMLNDMTDVVRSYRENPIVGGRVERIVNDLFDNAQQQGGRITGQGYADTNSKISDIIRNTDDAAEREAMMEVKRILDDAVEANLPPAEQGSWRTVRQQYRDFLPIENAKAQSSPTASRGTITPSALRTGVRGIEGKREVATGDRPMTELAEAGQGILEKPPNSGTQPRMREELARIIGQALTGGGTVGGAAALSGMPPLLAGALGGGAALTTALAQPLRNAYTRSGIGQAMLGRQGPAFPQGSRAGLASIVAAIQAAKQQQEAENEELRRGGPR